MHTNHTLAHRPKFSSSESVNMMRKTLYSLATVALFAAPLTAQDSTAAKAPTIPVRKLGPVEAKTAQSLGNVNMLRALSNGTLLVNDGMRRQIVLFDENLKIAKVVADTLEAPIPYGQRNAGLLPYIGDSTLIVDPATLSLLVLNPQGEMVRVMSAPRSNELNQLANANLGSNAFDSEGRLIYRTGGGGGGGGFGGGFAGTPGMMGMAGGGPGGGRGGDGGRGGQTAQPAQGGRGGAAPANPNQQTAAEVRRQVAAVQEDRFPSGGNNSAQITVNGERRTRSFNQRTLPDSVPILRANFDTRKTDTVAFMRVTNPQMEMKATEDGGTQMSVKMNPLPQNDDWALMSDGTVAVVRVLDYRIDYIGPDGSVQRSAPLPFDWKRITDEEKEKIVDSLKTASKEATERAQQMMAASGGGGRFRPAFDPVDASYLPDYFPPIRAGSTLADKDGNLWILPTTSTLAAQMSAMIPANMRGQIPAGMLPAGMAAPEAAGLAYDVVNRKGELVHRVQIPAGRSIAGFGTNGVVYLLERKGREVFLEKTRLLPN
jgi:hypothetical protein